LEIALKKIQSMPENNLSREILKPLFSKIFKCKVEFSGGGIEKGRDLIIFKKCDTGLFDEYISVQVKKSIFTPNSNKNSFQQLLNQLNQAIKEDVIDHKGNKIKTSKIIFITPYTISERTYDTHKGALKEITSLGVKIIDGASLIPLIKDHAPDLYKFITGESELPKKINSTLTNEPLMKALSIKNHKDIDEIHCESSINIGNNGSKIRFIKTSEKYLSKKKEDIPQEPKALTDFKNKFDLEKSHNIINFNDYIKTNLKVNFICGKPEEVTKIIKNHLSLVKKYDELKDEKIEIQTSINGIISGSNYNPNSERNAHLITAKNIEEIIKTLEEKIRNSDYSDSEIDIYSDIKKSTKALKNIEDKIQKIQNEIDLEVKRI